MDNESTMNDENGERTGKRASSQRQNQRTRRLRSRSIFRRGDEDGASRDITCRFSPRSTGKRGLSGIQSGNG